MALLVVDLDQENTHDAATRVERSDLAPARRHPRGLIEVNDPSVAMRLASSRDRAPASTEADMGYLMWGISAATGAAAGNIMLAVAAIAIAIAAFAGAFIWRVGQQNRGGQPPNDDTSWFSE